MIFFLFCTGLKYCHVQFHFDIAFATVVIYGKEHSEINQHCTFFKNSLKIKEEIRRRKSNKNRQHNGQR